MRGIQVHQGHNGVLTVGINKNLIFLAVVRAALLLTLASRPRATAGADARDACCAAPRQLVLACGLSAMLGEQRALARNVALAPPVAASRRAQTLTPELASLLKRCERSFPLACVHDVSG